MKLNYLQKEMKERMALEVGKEEINVSIHFSDGRALGFQKDYTLDMFKEIIKKGIEQVEKESIDELVDDTINDNHKYNFYREVKQMIKVVESVMYDEMVTDIDVLNSTIDDEITWEERKEIKRENQSYKRHGFERIKAIVKDYENVFEKK